MKHFVKTNAKRITAAILCAVICIAALPFSAFAFTAEEGKKVDAYYGAKYVGYDGEKYYAPNAYQYIAYDSNGNISLHTAGSSHANFLFTLWKRVRKYGAYATGITQNVDDLLQSHTARTMLANSEFIVMLNQASTDRLELAKLLNISDTQLSYITNVDAGHGLIKVGSSLVPFANKFPKNTKLYKLMTTKPGEGA